MLFFKTAPDRLFKGGKKGSFLYSDHLCHSGENGISTMEGKKIERSVLVTRAPVSIPSSNALPSLSSKVAPSLLVFLPSLSLSLHTSKQVSLSLWGIETVNAWSFDVPLPREPSQSSACTRLPSLHHLIILCGGKGEREITNLSRSAPSLLGTEFLFLSNAWRGSIFPPLRSLPHSLPRTLFTLFVASSAVRSMKSLSGSLCLL